MSETIWHDHYTENGNWMFNCGRSECTPYFEHGYTGRPQVIETGPAAEARDRLEETKDDLRELESEP